MKSLLVFITFVASMTAMAGRPTPKGDSMAQINTVMETVALGAKVLSIRLEDAASLGYIIEFQNHGETFCRAQGYSLQLSGRDPLTAAPTYSIESDRVRRTCVVIQ